MRKILWYAFLLIPAVFTSCNLEDDSGLIPQENRKLTISFSVQDPASGLATRAAIAPEAGEENIKTLDLIFFESNGNGTGTFKGWKELTSASGSPLEMNTDIVFDFSDIGLKTTDAYDILAVANMGSNYLPTDGSQSMDDWKNAIKNSNFKTARAEVQAFMAGTSADIPEYITKPIVSEALLMSASLRKESEDTKISIVLQRSVARFDVYNSAAGYTLESVSVWNGYPSLFVWNGEPTAFDKAAKRIARLYGGESEAGADIVGKLYAYENYVPAPKQNDQVTTCLIIKVRNKQSGTASYHRVNVHPLESGQSLKRNNVYKLTVNSVKKEGYATELEAYKGALTSLSYSINYWDMDSHGTVQFDGDNILAIPSKKVLFTPNGGSYDLGIFTFGEGTLSISKKVLDNGLSATLNGKTLTVSATALDNVKDRCSGIVELSFGNLKATIDVVQLEGGDLYLELNPKTISHFGNTAGVAVSPIAVKSSGEWSASIYPPGAGAFFSFAQTGSAAVTDYDSSKAVNNIIPIYTHTGNTGISPRYGFMVVSLKEDPSVQGTMLLIQDGVPGFTLTPDIASIDFEYDGELTITGNNTNSFLVNPGLTADGSTVNEWEYVLEGNDAAAFEVKDTHDASDPKLNRITVKAKSHNEGNSILKARLYLALKASPGVKSHVIDISQQPMSFGTGVPGNTLYISENADETQLITLQGGSGMRWIAELEQPEPATAHAYNIKMTGENGTEMSWGSEYTMSTKFKVNFPKTLYKDANRNITYNVKLTLAGTAVTIRLAIVRTVLQPIAINTANLSGGYGSLGNGIFSTFREYGNYGTFFGPQGIVYTPAVPTLPNSDNNNAGVGADIPDNVNILFSGTYTSRIANYYDNLLTWLKSSPGKNRIAVITLDNSVADNQALFTKIASLGYTYKSNSSVSAIWVGTHSNDPVWDYIVKNGPFSNYNPSQSIDFTALFYRDGISGSFDTPTGVTHVLEVPGYGCSLSVDLQRRIIVIGDSQHTNTWTPTYSALASTTDNKYYGRGILWASLWAIIYNTAQYGDHFTDALK